MKQTQLHIKQLELLIEQGEQLRDEMRRTAESKDAIIRRQAGELKYVAKINKLLRERRNRTAIQLHITRNETRSIRVKLEKLKRRGANDEAFHAAVKAVAIEMGIWGDLRDRALSLVAQKDNAMKCRENERE